MSSGNSRLKKKARARAGSYNNGRGLSWASREKYLKEPSMLDLVFSDQVRGNVIVQLNVESTTEDLEDYIRKHGRALTGSSAGLIGWVPGYDTDPRELWEIPEVIELFKRVIDSGLLSLFASNMPNIPGEEYNPYAIGASQIYCAVHETMVKRAGKCCWDKMDVQQFLAVWTGCNEKVDKLLAG